MKLLKEQVMTISSAYVFDIKRFAVHDGQGLRTTVFFKGCPLRCKWCQNPEGLSFNVRPIYFEKTCIHCRLCEKAAYKNQMIYKDRPYFNLEFNGDFDNLIQDCPSASIRYDASLYTIDELLEKILDDKVFYQDNGGVTFSGGEPFSQGEFLINILKSCKEKGIHTAIESSFYAPIDLVKEALPYLDQIYADCKVYDDSLHRQIVGVSNKRILDNIEYMLKSEHRDKVTIRTPLIPSMNATKENIADISKFLSNCYGDVKYELLNYNPLASSKYSLVDLEFELDKKIKPFTAFELNEFYDVVIHNGIKNLIKE